MPYDFSGRRIVVTGGATGVGAALLDLLAESGATDVTVLDVKQPDGPHATYLPTDLADPAAVDAAIAAIDGPLDALFNNAGVADTLPPATVFQVNVLAPIRLAEALLPQFTRGGAIVTTASIAGLQWPRTCSSSVSSSTSATGTPRSRGSRVATSGSTPTRSPSR